LLHRLNEVALKSDEDDLTGSGPVDIKLQQCATELHAVCAAQIQRTIENMMTCAIKEVLSPLTQIKSPANLLFKKF